LKLETIDMPKLSEAEQFIIGQAMAEIKKEKDVSIVREKILGTVVGVNKKAVKIFDELVASKRKAGLIT